MVRWQREEIQLTKPWKVWLFYLPQTYASRTAAEAQMSTGHSVATLVHIRCLFRERAAKTPVQTDAHPKRGELPMPWQDESEPNAPVSSDTSTPWC